MKQKLTIATRGSKLALRQTEIVKQYLVAQFPGLVVEYLVVTTQGDTDQKTPLSSFGNTGVFVKGLEEKLLSSEADLAVHSLKDVPSEIHPDLLLAAFPEREDARDVLITAKGIHWLSLKPDSVVGTSSPARKEQLKLLRPDLVFKDIRGNVETRVQKVLNGEYDATILAAAGLKRIGYKIEDKSFFTFDQMVPSPGQGALVIQVSKNNKVALEMVQIINNEKVEKQVKAERAFMSIIGGGCRFPVAAHAEINADDIIFRGIAFKPGFEKIEKIKIRTSKNDLFEMAQKEAERIISKYNKK
jgi:hydroxymethylbilane synthase